MALPRQIVFHIRHILLRDGRAFRCRWGCRGIFKIVFFLGVRSRYFVFSLFNDVLAGAACYHASRAGRGSNMEQGSAINASGHASSSSSTAALARFAQLATHSSASSIAQTRTRAATHALFKARAQLAKAFARHAFVALGIACAT